MPRDSDRDRDSDGRKQVTEYGLNVGRPFAGEKYDQDRDDR